MKFSAIPGLGDVKSLLIEAARSNHIAHAQLFVGAEGALNLPMAIAFATYLHCENKGETDSCGTCPACSKSNKFIHPDTHFVFPLRSIRADEDRERIKAEMLKSWRAFLLEQPFADLNDWTSYYGGEDKPALISREESRDIIKTLSLKPFESQYKVMIIWQPELMHSSAANGILKILEEPAPYTFFFLVTNAADKLLPTIISRTQIITIPLLGDELLNEYLIQQHNMEATQAARVTSLAEGNINFALKLVDSEEVTDAKQFTDWMRACYSKSYGSLVLMADAFYGLDKLSRKNLLKYSMNALRETLLHISGADEMSRSQGNEFKLLKEFSKVMNTEKIEKSFTLMNDATYHLERNGSPKMIFLDLSLKLARTINP
ncbi:MAG: DNA polymerase III subunit delta [Cyclobacteriaceae bacterium]|jgi:DNA polymerase-3 subunit delta'|nr:DNA polymerase III subunit delta [Cyclobacteriaceae bacterium]MDH4296529.1 DNA polymerase III subunit delta [Cyclobacteriaceae bacterium]MDH5248792.1 DNA polymerase III subunit delta [Cyclobacteriaceae bacterium]